MEEIIGYIKDIYVDVQDLRCDLLESENSDKWEIADEITKGILFELEKLEKLYSKK